MLKTNNALFVLACSLVSGTAKYLLLVKFTQFANSIFHMPQESNHPGNSKDVLLLPCFLLDISF